MNENKAPPPPNPMTMSAMWPGSNFQRPTMYGQYPGWNMMQYRMPYQNMNQPFTPNPGLLQAPYPGMNYQMMSPMVMPPTPSKPPQAPVPTDIPLPEGPPPEKAPLPSTPINSSQFTVNQQTPGFIPFALSNKKKRKNKKKNNNNMNLWQNNSPHNVANIPKPPLPSPIIQNQQPVINVVNSPSPATNPTTNWPASLNEYVNRAYQDCESNVDKDLMGLMLKGKITAAINSNELYSRNWSLEPIPKLRSTQNVPAKEENTPKPVTFKVKVTDRLGTVVRNYRGTQRAKSRSSSRDRSRSRSRSSRSRSRSRSSSRSNRRRRSRSRSSDERRSFVFKKNTPNSKKRRKNNNKKGAASIEFNTIKVSDEKMQQRAARFTHGSSRGNPSAVSVYSRLQFDIDTEGDNLPEITDCHVVGTSYELEKPFLRLTSAPDPSQVRSVNALRKSLAHVLEKWNNTRDYHYTCEQLKSIRQDLTVQGIRDEFTIEVYEAHARICLEKKDPEEFNQCQTQLKMLYSELGGKNEMEFTAYRIMYYLYTKNTQDLISIIGQISGEEKQNTCIKHALKVAQAWYTNNYHQFFQSYLTAPLTTALMIEWFIERERKAALRTMIKAYRQTLPVVLVAERLAFVNVEQFLEFTAPLLLTYSGEANSLIDCKASMAALGSF